MLAKDKRLNLKKDFSFVAKGFRIEDSILKLFYRFGENNNPKIGIAIPSAAFKKAVDRNRVRRIISKGFETLYSALPKNINIVALPKKDALKLNSEEIFQNIEKLLHKL